ncbi:uncharacterized protein LOC111894869 [Lactuca sativa]|uniref:uncharacterized protein LOC111894869 n=1 Tax=Lactuca sativa TaxID=4236 RepID=UPI000CD855EB|nr:uncharacterized protein LOC111894869 [Lactuca sativa]
MSHLFDDMYNRTAPYSSFDVCGTPYRYGYYPLDEIYHNHSCFVKLVSCPNDRKWLKFKRAQEKTRKDVERAFGAFKICWHILKHPTVFVDDKKISEVMYICIILHNIILEDEGNAICEYNENEIVPLTQAFEVGSNDYLVRRAIIHDVETHHVLHRDFKEHIWTVDHIDLNVEPIDDLDG